VSTIKTTNIQHPDAEEPNIVLTPQGSIEFDAGGLTVAFTDDTGVPWEIPFIDGGSEGSLATFTEDVAVAVAAGLDEASSNASLLTSGTIDIARIPNAAKAGIGSNVAQVLKTDVFSTTSTSFTTVTGLSTTITPSSATSKILLIASVSLSPGVATVFNSAMIRLAGGNAATYIGDAASSRIRSVAFTGSASNFRSGLQMFTNAMVYLDSPNTTSATTYSVEIRNSDTDAVYVNRSGNDTNSASFGRGASTLIAIEVAA
jgi:hypothetical protein